MPGPAMAQSHSLSDSRSWWLLAQHWQCHCATCSLQLRLPYGPSSAVHPPWQSKRGHVATGVVFLVVLHHFAFIWIALGVHPIILSWVALDIVATAGT